MIMSHRPHRKEKRLSARRIAEAWGQSWSTFRDILRAADMSGSDFDPIRAAAVIINHHQKKWEGPEGEAALHRARRTAAEADAAEIDTARKLDMFLLKVDVDMMWKDAIQQGVENISNLRELTKTQKELGFRGAPPNSTPNIDEEEYGR